VRTLAVRVDVRGRALEAVARDVAATIAADAPRRGLRRSRRRVRPRAPPPAAALLGALALAGIFVLLTIDFGSPWLAALVMVNVPLAFVGGVVAVLVGAAGTLSLGAIVGFVTVFGITIRNGIGWSPFPPRRARAGRPLDTAELVIAAGDRLAPILMTALVTGIALVPLLALGSRAGGEIEQPMALVIVGGLLTSTWLNLFLIPLSYARAARRRGSAPAASEA
jgi:Cu/Ag efflux pump CusA